MDGYDIVICCLHFLNDYEMLVSIHIILFLLVLLLMIMGVHVRT